MNRGRHSEPRPMKCERIIGRGWNRGNFTGDKNEGCNYLGFGWNLAERESVSRTDSRKGYLCRWMDGIRNFQFLISRRNERCFDSTPFSPIPSNFVCEQGNSNDNIRQRNLNCYRNVRGVNNENQSRRWKIFHDVSDLRIIHRWTIIFVRDTHKSFKI